MASSNSRATSTLVLLNGVAVGGVLGLEIESNSHLAANRFRVRIAMDVSGYQIWATSQPIIEIQLSIDGAWQSMITGAVDTLEVDLGRNEITIDGRDFTARFIEARLQGTFENRTAGDIVSTLAAQQGLLATITPTEGFAGRNFQSSTSKTSLDQYSGSTTQWDLLTQLAMNVGYDIWVTGSTLNFAPLPANNVALPLSMQDCHSITLERNFPLSSGLAVSVRSWDCRGQQSILQTSRSEGQGSQSPAYVVVRPNLNATAANALAQRLLADMVQQARTVTIEMPGDLSTVPRNTITLYDTNTDFDGTYLVTDVTRQVSFDRGFTQTVQARIPPWIASSIS